MKESMQSNNSAGGVAGESGDMFNQNDSNHFAPNQPQTRCPDEKLGFIMCECGLEGISLKVRSV